MNEDAAIAVSLNQPRVWEQTISFITRLINNILNPKEETIYSHPNKGALGKAHKMIRLAENYGDAYEDIVNRIRQESARYKAFKKNPEAIGKVTLNVKRLDSGETCQRQYEVKDPAEGKASVFYTHRSSADIVLEFVLHDKNDVPLFAVARTYSNWVGCKEFDLGGDRAFYLNMVEDEQPGHVSVQAGFKAKKAVVPDLALYDATPDGHGVTGKAADSGPFNLVQVASALAVVVFCCFIFMLIAKPNAVGGQNASTPVAAESPAKTVNVPQITRIIWTNLTPALGHNSVGLGGENRLLPGRATSRSKKAARIGTFAVSVNATSMDESVRCGQALINKIEEGLDGEAKKVDGAASSMDRNCGDTVKFVVSFEPIERIHDNFLFPLGDGEASMFANDYKLGGQEFFGGTDELANILLRVITGHPVPKSGSDDKGGEVAMTE